MMEGPVGRQLFAQCVIATALCVGGWYLLVKPNLDEGARLARECEAAGRVEKIDERSLEQIARRAAELRERAGAIKRGSEFGQDPSKLYAAFVDMAQRFGVRVQRIAPGAERVGRDSLRVRHVDIFVEGGFEELLAYIDAIDMLEGFIRISSFGVTPREEGEKRLLSARLGCEVVALSPEALAVVATGGFDGP